MTENDKQENSLPGKFGDAAVSSSWRSPIQSVNFVSFRPHWELWGSGGVVDRPKPSGTTGGEVGRNRE